MEDHLRALGTGALHLFTTWKRDAGLPEAAAGVYTIWRRIDVGAGAAGAGPEQLVYVGYAGRDLAKPQGRGSRSKGLRDRIRAHASGSRSGDQLAVYVADRLVLPTLSQLDIAAVAEGRVAMDRLIRNYILDHLGFRWVQTPDAATARKLEAVLRRGGWDHGKPLFNPLEK